ncbi:MAG: DNA starvation/stationary phase protection protein Dps [Gemmatimonadetes bacterium]|nr:MAG: DNA starvation/stationary phase protection protein Dps [Gemmatimonadota bacterium]PYO97676.1 MAG: DNA starvation/stationary phase protection protein Dps [Gemmatimonadota bacterium]
MTDLAFDTSNDLPKDVRAQVVGLLNDRLADAIDLETQTKQAHWNVKGPQFIALHKLFDEVHDAVEEYVDLLAERVVQLGGIAEGTVRMVAERTELTDYPRQIVDGAEHVNALAGALAEFGTRIRRAIDETDDLGDADSQDICIEISRGIDKWLWFVEAHVETPVKAH